MRGQIKADHIPLNKFTLLMGGLPVALTPTKISGIEEELETTDLPDRTRASGGNTKPTEFTMEIPMHHLVEQAAMEQWFRQAQDPVLPTYKLFGTLIHSPISGGLPRTFTLNGVFPTKRKLPDLDMSNEGEMAVVEWTCSCDQLLPI